MDNKSGNETGKERQYSFADLLGVMDALLAEDGCPWDRAQTHESLKRYLIEEAYEALEAIDEKNGDSLCEELGDVMLQVVFHAKIAASFDIGDVIGRVCEKMVSRHPHVFGSNGENTPECIIRPGDVKTPGDVLSNWEKIKRDEQGLSGHTQALRRVPANLPSLMRAYKVQQKARDAGFDWDDATPVIEKAEEELGELRQAVASGGRDEIGDEFGDLLFALVNVSRFIDVHPELALTAATEKFIRRFAAMEKLVNGEGRPLDGMTLSEMDEYWERVK
jgi:tetrapyrrole methylase family protein/MazG family protein